MARIAGINLPNKKIPYALTYVKGIGLSTSRAICYRAGIEQDRRVSSLTEEEISKIKSVIEEMSAPEPADGGVQLLLEGDLVRHVQKKIQNLKAIKCYRGLRHISKLPVRGQNTRRNARTRKGKAIAIAGKKKAVK